MLKRRDYSQFIDQNKYQVFLFKSEAFFPFYFAIHPWFVLNKKGELSRWEVCHTKKYDKAVHFGYIYKNRFPFFQGIGIIPLVNKFFSESVLLGKVEGEEALKMINFIENSPNTYLYKNKYILWGPNSNTFAEWVINNFPESGFKLPNNAYGKNFK
jgi:hypothetical protein